MIETYSQNKQHQVLVKKIQAFKKWESQLFIAFAKNWQK